MAIEAERLKLERLRHLVALDNAPGALATARELIDSFDADDRLISIVDCYERLGPLGKARLSLEPHRLLYIARAYVRLHRMREAKLLLDRFRPNEPLELSTWHALRSELAKNSGKPGWRDTALDEIERAIECCAQQEKHEDPEIARAAIEARGDWEMNRARLLQYLFYKPARAAEAYRNFLKRWQDFPGHRLPVAIAKRNLAECLISMAPSELSNLQEAERQLREAENLIEAQARNPLLAEIAYERAKIAESRGDSPISGRQLLELSVERARASGNGMVEAIASARLFWMADDFDFDRWLRIEQKLLRYRGHGWALRTVINGRLRAARKLEASNRPAALSLLRQNKADMEVNPGYDQGSDQRRIVETLSGILVLADDLCDQAEARAAADTKPWIAEWQKQQGFASLSDAWLRMG
jgi:hypothetical protein